MKHSTVVKETQIYLENMPFWSQLKGEKANKQSLLETKVLTWTKLKQINTLDREIEQQVQKASEQAKYNQRSTLCFIFFQEESSFTIGTSKETIIAQE